MRSGERVPRSTEEIDVVGMRGSRVAWSEGSAGANDAMDVGVVGELEAI